MARFEDGTVEHVGSGVDGRAVTSARPGAALAGIGADHGSPTITLRGDLDVVSGHEVADAIHDVLRDSEDARVIVDLAGVTSCDVAGLRALLVFEPGHRKRLVYANPPPTTRELLRLVDPAGTLTVLTDGGAGQADGRRAGSRAVQAPAHDDRP